MPATTSHTSILISGATGLVGSYLIRYLYQQGYRNIRGMRRPTSNMSLVGTIANDIEWVEGDILDPYFLEEAMRDISVVYHCAALVSFESGHASGLFRTNVEGTENMVNAALEAGIDQFIHVSSVAALGRSRNKQTISEDTPWERSPWLTNYAISKFQGEQEVWRGEAEGLTISILNPSIILGGGDWERGPSRFFPLIGKGWRFYPMGNSGFVDVRDVARLLVLLMEERITGKRFIANAGHLTYREFFAEIARQLGQRPPDIPVRPWMSGLAWRLSSIITRLSGRRPFLTRETARQSGRTHYYDNSRSLEELSFTYRPLTETIRETAALYQQQYSQPSPPPTALSLPFEPQA